VTCGAPCDHARGFGKVNGAGGVYGGLERLERKRCELSNKAQEARLKLLRAVKNSQDKRPDRSHISTSDTSCVTLRDTAIDREQQLAAVTWQCALRRANVMSQAIGVAVTSYLSSISWRKRVNGGSEEVFRNWKEFGYLLCFEGMLSAAGNEKHMIEDACTGIEMLRGVSIVFARGLGEQTKKNDLTDVPGNGNIIGVQMVNKKDSAGSSERGARFGKNFLVYLSEQVRSVVWRGVGGVSVRICFLLDPIRSCMRIYCVLPPPARPRARA